MMDDTVKLVIAGAVGIAILSIVGYLMRQRRESHDASRRSEWLRSQRERHAVQRGDIEKLARRIIATSSTAAIAGFAIERQIEAVFTDGHATPPEAVEVLKAVAAEKGANALINLEGVRVGTGKCAARGDAVIVRALQRMRLSDEQPHSDIPGHENPD